MPLDASWTSDPAFSAALDSPLIHEANKVRDEQGRVIRYQLAGFWIEGVETGPGAYSDAVHTSGWPTNFSRKGYIFYDFVAPGAVPIYDDPAVSFNDLYDPADVKDGSYPRIDLRWTSTVPEPGDFVHAPRLTINMHVFGYQIDERKVIEDTYPASNWTAINQGDLAGDSLDERGIPAVAVELPGQDLREVYVDDPALELTSLAPTFPSFWNARLVVNLPRATIGREVALRQVFMGPTVGRSAYLRYATSEPFGATWDGYSPPAPGVGIAGRVEAGAGAVAVRRHPNRVVGNFAPGVAVVPDAGGGYTT